MVSLIINTPTFFLLPRSLYFHQALIILSIETEKDCRPWSFCVGRPNTTRIPCSIIKNRSAYGEVPFSVYCDFVFPYLDKSRDSPIPPSTTLAHSQLVGKNGMYSFLAADEWFPILGDE